MFACLWLVGVLLVCLVWLVEFGASSILEVETAAALQSATMRGAAPTCARFVPVRGVFLPPFVRKWPTPSKRNPSLRGGRSIVHKRWQTDPPGHCASHFWYPHKSTWNLAGGSWKTKFSARTRIPLMSLGWLYYSKDTNPLLKRSLFLYRAGKGSHSRFNFWWPPTVTVSMEPNQ